MPITPYSTHDFRDVSIWTMSYEIMYIKFIVLSVKAQ